MSAYGGYLFQVLSFALFHRHCTVMQCLWRHLTLLKLHHPNPKTYVQNQGFPFPATLGLAYGIKKNNSLQKTLSISHLETMQIPFNKASPGSRLWPETSLTLMDCAAQFILDEPGTHLKTIGFSHHIIAWHLAKKSRRFPPWGPWGWRNHQWQTNMLYITLRSSTLW
jgi:hypothetical protein